MASLQQVVDGLRSLNKKNKELINIINELSGSAETTITKGVDALADKINNNNKTNNTPATGSFYSYEDIITGRFLNLDESIFVRGNNSEPMNGRILNLNDSIFYRDDLNEKYNKSIAFLKNYIEITEIEIFNA